MKFRKYFSIPFIFLSSGMYRENPCSHMTQIPFLLLLLYVPSFFFFSLYCHRDGSSLNPSLPGLERYRRDE